jgi:hypothetical protein
MGIITAEALYTNPYNARMEISDLGATENGVVLHPSATIFNLTMLVAGTMILTAVWFLHRALHRKAITIPTGLLGLGVLGVGIFPGNIHPQHPLFARLDLGGVERWMVHPMLLWLVAFGGWLSGSAGSSSRTSSVTSMVSPQKSQASREKVSPGR